MNELEMQMIEILKAGARDFGYVGVKAEFEAEGTRMDELLRLVHIGRMAGVKIALKIGGCEAVSDLYTAKQMGVDYIIAPMIETPYALSKYIEAKNKVYDTSSRYNPKFLFNLETVTGYENLASMVEQALVENGADGVVFGRGDFAQSKGMERTKVDSEVVTECCVAVAKACKDNNLELVVGGGVSAFSYDALKKIHNEFLSRFETRKVIFNSTALDQSNIEEALKMALKFELLWLQNKQEYYAKISKEDASRIEALQKRFN